MSALITKTPRIIGIATCPTTCDRKFPPKIPTTAQRIDPSKLKKRYCGTLILRAPAKKEGVERTTGSSFPNTTIKAKFLSNTSHDF